MYHDHKCMVHFVAYGCCWVVLFASFLGCAAGLREVRPPEDSIVCASGEAPQEGYEGSLWEDDGVLGGLFVDNKARRVGDIVTVNIVETSTASNQASTNSGRKSSVSGGMESFFNMEKRFPSSHPFFNPFSSVKGGLESTFDGKGSTTRSGKLNAYLTAMVTEVLPNGNLRIQGSREVTVNNDSQYLLLSGIVRPKDISTSNVVLSTYISDAQIAYSGAGVINDRQRPGWMARILDTAWPF